MVENNASVIKDLIIPLDRYPHLNENQTLQEAVQVFMAFRAGEQDRLLYTQLLAVNNQNQLVGKLSIIDILHGMAPRLMDASRASKFEGKDMEYPNLSFLYEEKTFSECGKNQKTLIKPLLHVIDFSLPADTHILKALVMMTHRNDFNVPVTENGNVIGVLRLEEIFDAMCNTYCAI